ncbi:hypothetical protein BDR07DRAFT_830675 [Suillus spraguei]|nr:hypothetical protein BDR07DRAFT_830675 [Suillus spraguei]
MIFKAWPVVVICALLLCETLYSKSRNVSMCTIGPLHMKSHPWCVQELVQIKRDVRRTGNSCGGMEWIGFC